MYEALLILAITVILYLLFRCMFYLKMAFFGLRVTARKYELMEDMNRKIEDISDNIDNV